MDIFSKLRDMRILLIDDDEWIRDSLRIFFEGEGCQLQALETAEEGLELLKGQHYDVIITDYRLPGMDGLDFLRSVQDSHFGTMTVLITAYGNEGIVSEARKIGVQDIIEKPFTSKTIEESLSRLIQRRDEKKRSPATKPRKRKSTKTEDLPGEQGRTSREGAGINMETDTPSRKE